jgi:hypothetical protein
MSRDRLMAIARQVEQQISQETQQQMQEYSAQAQRISPLQFVPRSYKCRMEKKERRRIQQERKGGGVKENKEMGWRRRGRM